MAPSEAVAKPWTMKLRQVFATGQPQELFSTWPAPGGEQHYHTRFVAELRDGQIETVLTITRDTTALWQSRQALRESRDLLHAIAETQTASLSAFRALRDEHGRIVDLGFLFANAVANH